MNSTTSLRIFAVLIAATFWGVVFTFRDFFFFNPLEADEVLRQVQLLVSTLGWISLSSVVPLLLLMIAQGHHKLVQLLPYAGLLWPVGVASTQLTLRIQNGVWFTNYLTTYPVFIVTEIVLPLCVVLIWKQLRQTDAEEAVASE